MAHSTSSGNAFQARSFGMATNRRLLAEATLQDRLPSRIRQNNSHQYTWARLQMTDRDLTRTYSRAQFVAKLRRLADSIEAAEPFTIQVAGERLRIPADATFNIEHERLGSREEIEFQLIWSQT